MWKNNKGFTESHIFTAIQQGVKGNANIQTQYVKQRGRL